ncbi:MAG: DeoR/GlpR family DNA-binding transcription regulator [Pseudomonadota bacterium]
MPLSFRHEEIIAIARDIGRVTVEDLSQRFDVSPQTIRRDLGELCDDGILTRVHGGAILSSGLANIGYSTRRQIAQTEKDAIGQLCADTIPNDCSMFINIGTTTEAVARALRRHRDIMAITNNLNVANILAENDQCEVVVAGGVLRRSDGGLVGEATGDFVRQFKVDYAIIGVSAIDEDGALLDFDYREVRVAQEIIKNARRTFLVADSSKFTRGAPVRIGSLTDIDTFFTDVDPPDLIRDLCRASEVRIIVVDQGQQANTA